MSRLQDDLRKIVGVDKIQKELDAIKDTDPITGKRGIAYQNGSNGNLETASGTSGSGGTTAPNSALGSSLAAIRLAATDAANAALGGLSGANGFGGGRTPTKQGTDGVFDLADILDGYADSVLQDSNNSGFSPNLSGINGWTDCVSEEPGMVRFDSYIPPVDWPDTTEAPLDDTWQVGYYWGDGGDWATPAEGAIARVDALNGFSGGSPLYTYQNMRVTATSSGIPTQYSYDIYADGVFSSTVNSIRNNCSGSAAPYCSTTPVTVPWQLDYFQVLFNNETGLYETNLYDPIAPEDYNTPASTVYMCFDGGTRTAVLTAGAGDTKLLYETDPTNGAPLAGSYLHIYDSKGQIKGYADVALIEQYSP